ncbi:hypothetical protein [Candidatus Thiosymbion oneisti]|uniref:hypothetical protein n=1 Tax=Candidatus Thiosymbion oneisti TaxID=589554 RepID=UPI0010614F98|nr:hypothetical protein [Candidatus Thiosymbion oneisti]
MTAFAIATEDALSEAVAETLLHQVGICDIQACLRKEGFGYLRSRIADFNRIAEKATPVLLITDLDQKHCPPGMIADWLQAPPSPRLLFRIAVRETESWVLADRIAFARFIGVSVAAMPTTPDELSDPKAAVLKLVRKSSNRELKQDILPPKGSTSPVGLGYNSRLRSFVHSHWRSDRAAKQSPSLARALMRVQALLA